jgi:hypothetical protein
MLAKSFIVVELKLRNSIQPYLILEDDTLHGNRSPCKDTIKILSYKASWYIVERGSAKPEIYQRWFRKAHLVRQNVRGLRQVLGD